MALPFDFREDAVLLFDMGIRETWAFVNQVPGLNLAAPYVLAIGIFWILQACRNRGTVKSTFAVPTLAFVASISPFFFDLRRLRHLSLGFLDFDQFCNCSLLVAR